MTDADGTGKSEVNEKMDVQQDDPVTSHNDTFDISPQALGNQDPNYYRNPRFLGTVMVR
jgi:hypothetical protein